MSRSQQVYKKKYEQLKQNYNACLNNMIKVYCFNGEELVMFGSMAEDNIPDLNKKISEILLMDEITSIWIF